MSEAFGRVSRSIAHLAGTPAAFLGAALIIVGWAVAGPVFGFSDTWQLVINTGTTIVTFLMVFLIQNTQNRDSVAVQLKLDELIHALSGARDELIDLEEDSEETLRREQRRFRDLAARVGAASDATTDAARAVEGALQEDGARQRNGANPADS